MHPEYLVANPGSVYNAAENTCQCSKSEICRFNFVNNTSKCECNSTAPGSNCSASRLIYNCIAFTNIHGSFTLFLVGFLLFLDPFLLFLVPFLLFLVPFLLFLVPFLLFLVPFLLFLVHFLLFLVPFLLFLAPFLLFLVPFLFFLVPFLLFLVPFLLYLFILFQYSIHLTLTLVHFYTYNYSVSIYDVFNINRYVACVTTRNDTEPAEDEVFLALDMAQEVSSNMKKILEKLEKLDTLENVMDKAAGKIDSIENQFTHLGKKMDSLETKQLETEEAIKELNAASEKMADEKEHMWDRLNHFED
ncbi:hypothetical protein QZH41_016478 [Actinostola sp. cb2023]|nr:hypothetical protein QZH41_016478 [Actinostola sp. cb2023]